MDYINKVQNDLGKFSGRAFWTGRGQTFVNQPLGKNSFFAIPHEVAKVLKKDKPECYSFHSFRRTSATVAAESGISANQMTDFYGWKSPSMANEYISTSKKSLRTMAEGLRLSSNVSVGDYSYCKLEDNSIDKFGPETKSEMINGIHHNEKVVIINGNSGTINF